MRRGITACLIFLLMFPVVLRASPSAAEKVPVTREYFENPDTESGSDAGRAAEAESIDMEEAAAEMRQAIRERFHGGGWMPSCGASKPDFELFDVTGDGCPDLCKCVTWGSGMVRTDLVVYDPAGKELYVLDGYDYSYLIDRVGEDRIIVAMKGPYGSERPIMTTFGTIRMEDGRLVFVPDS